MIFDTAAGALSPASFKAWVQPVLTRLANKFPNKVGYYSRETQDSFFNTEFLSLPFVGMGFDHRWNLNECFSLKKTGFVQGNFDQALLFQEGEEFKKSVNLYIDNLKKISSDDKAGWVCGLGHGVLPKTPEANVHYFIKTMREAFR
jgi:uroporphyrinogen decarboxylase